MVNQFSEGDGLVGSNGGGEEGRDSSWEAQIAWGIVSLTLDAMVHYEGRRLSQAQGGNVPMIEVEEREEEKPSDSDE